jgi:hypothetical protein
MGDGYDWGREFVCTAQRQIWLLAGLEIQCVYSSVLSFPGPLSKLPREQSQFQYSRASFLEMPRGGCITLAGRNVSSPGQGAPVEKIVAYPFIGASRAHCQGENLRLHFALLRFDGRGSDLWPSLRFCIFSVKLHLPPTRRCVELNRKHAMSQVVRVCHCHFLTGLDRLCFRRAGLLGSINVVVHLFLACGVRSFLPTLPAEATTQPRSFLNSSTWAAN